LYLGESAERKARTPSSEISLREEEKRGLFSALRLRSSRVVASRHFYRSPHDGAVSSPVDIVSFVTVSSHTPDVCKPQLLLMFVPRDGQTGRPARLGPGPVKPGQNRVRPAEPAGLIFCPNQTHSGPKRAGPARLARKKQAKKWAKQAGKHVLV
jgi:hypothetical protein